MTPVVTNKPVHRRRRRWRLSERLPLLARDLRDQAARPRTYILRFAYSCAFFLLLFWQMNELFQFLEDGLTLMDLGQGLSIFSRLMMWQITAIYLLMPVITAGSIADEKERDTLSVLMTTRVDPGTILIEKLASRMLAMLSLVVLSLPLMGFAYTLGGVTPGRLLASWLLLLTTTLLVGSFTMMWSAWSASTTSALISTVLWGLPLTVITAPVSIAAVSSEMPDDQAAPVCVFVVMMHVGLSWAFFVVGRRHLTQRATVSPRSELVRTFRFIDGTFTELNNRLAKGRVIVSGAIPLPENDPVYWRHRYHRALGTTRYLVRVLLAVSVPVILLFSLTITTATSWREHTGLMITLITLSALAVMLTAVRQIPSERGHQTLTILLSTPMSGRDIVWQLVRSLRALEYVLLVPVGIGIVIRLANFGWAPPDVLVCVLFAASAWALFRLCSWLGVVIGLHCHRPLKATLTAVGLLILWWFAPLLVRPTLADLQAEYWLAFVCPVWLLGAIGNVWQTSYYRIATGSLQAVSVGAIVLHAGASLVLCRYCLRRADRLLDRLDSTGTDASER